MRSGAFILILAFGSALYAQYTPPVPNPYTVGNRSYARVARVTVAQGDVNVRRGETGEFVTATANSVLTVRDRLQTSSGSKAEVELDASNLVRLAPNTEIGIVGSEYHRYRIQLGAGTILYRMSGDFEAPPAVVEMAGLTVTPRLKGECRISVLDDGMTQITARSGRVEVSSSQGSRQLWPGQTLFVRGNPAAPEWHSGHELARDQFDDWSAYRDRQPARPNQAAEGWKRFGDPGNSNTPRQSFADEQEHSGWHSFGQPEHPR